MAMTKKRRLHLLNVVSDALWDTGEFIDARVEDAPDGPRLVFETADGDETSWLSITCYDDPGAKL